jgi:chromosome segregation ATPase
VFGLIADALGGNQQKIKNLRRVLFMKSQLINSMLSFTLGTGASLVALAMWTGTTDLQQIKDSVQSYVAESEQHASALASDYQVVVEEANAEIGAYQEALAQANSNISQLITAYEQQEQQAEEDLAELQAELDNFYDYLDHQYERDINHFIEEANAEINKANEEVAQTKTDVNAMIEGSNMEDILAELENVQLDTTGDKTVTDISGIVGEVVEGE